MTTCPIGPGGGGHEPSHCPCALQPHGFCDPLCGLLCAPKWLMGLQAPGICLCFFLPSSLLPSWGHAAADPRVPKAPAPLACILWGTGRLHCKMCIFSCPRPPMLIFSTQQRAGQLGRLGSDWLLTAMLLCQPSQVGSASDGIITVVNSGFLSSSFTKAVVITIQESSFSLHRI